MNTQGQGGLAWRVFAMALALLVWIGIVALLEWCLFLLLSRWLLDPTNDMSSIVVLGFCVLALPLILFAVAPIGWFAYQRTMQVG
jgi:hypothetical protein